MCDLELESGFAFQGSRWLSSLGLEHLPNGVERLLEAQQLAERRVKVQEWIPKHLQFTRGWPNCVPTPEECSRLAQMRLEVGEMYGWDPLYITAETVEDRYRELWELKQQKEAAKK